jgi:hypothetical protein
VVSNSTYAERQIDGALSFPINGSDQFIGNDTRFKDGFRGPRVPFNVTLSPQDVFKRLGFNLLNCNAIQHDELGIQDSLFLGVFLNILSSHSFGGFLLRYAVVERRKGRPWL